MSSTYTTLRRRIPLALGVAGLVVALAVIAGASAVHCINSTSDLKTTGVTGGVTRPRSKHVHALGRLEPSGTVLRISPQSGNEGTCIERLLVHEGDDIAAGSLIAVLDNKSLREATVAELEAKKSLSEARLEQVKTGAKAGDIAAQQLSVDLQAEQLKVAGRELKRAQALHGKNVLTIEDLDNKQWGVDRLALEHRRAQELLKSLREVREIDVRVAECDVASAEAAVKRARVDLDAAYVRAPAAGRILKILTREGEHIGDQGLIELGDVQHMEAVAEVFEADVAHLRPNLKAVVKVDCLEEPLVGEVAQVGHRVGRKVVLTNDPVSDTDARVVEVRIRLAASDIDRLVRLSNARVEVRIELPVE